MPHSASPSSDVPADSPGAPLYCPPPTSDSLSEVFGTDIQRFVPEEREWILKAYTLAETNHRGVKRLSGEPYIVHPVAVAKLLMEQGLDWKAVCAALLHDLVEDTTITYEQIKATFPDPIADLVGGVTKISSLHFSSKHEEQTENLRKMIFAMARDVRVILIKLADRLHNMQTLQHLPAVKQRRIARSTMDIYAPLAHRLGIYRIKSELEDLSMRYLYPEAYYDLRTQIAAKKTDRETHIQESVAFLQARLKESNIDATVSGRPKHFWSIFQKMRTQKLSFDEIYDLNALRVICNTRSECYEILGIIHSIWKPVPEHFSDYIALPKENFYQSIHTKVLGLGAQMTEIQIRTWEMHRVAEEGIAAHWKYKEGRKSDAEFEKKLAWVRQMLDLADSGGAGELLHDLKQDIFDDKVFCFTPGGDVVEMQRGSNILDFAYRIHTDLGHRCIGAKIKNQFVPLRTELKMGDVVEIVTSKTPHPSSDWLKIITTPRARAKIKHWLKQRDYGGNVQLGRDMLLKGLTRAGLHKSAVEINATLEKHLANFHARSIDDLLSEVGFGGIPVGLLVARFLPPPVARPLPKPSATTPESESGKKTDTPAILVDGLPGTLTRIAQCCRPQPGDPISGVVTRGRGISIHNSQCSYLSRWLTQSPNFIARMVPVSWSSGTVSAMKEVGVRVTAQDRTGILRDVTDAISSLNIMIVASTSRSDQRRSQAILRFSVLVQNNGQLNVLLNRLGEIPDIVQAIRDDKFH